MSYMFSSKRRAISRYKPPGGRIHSCWLGDVVAELGAQWIHGACLPNSVFTLASQENLVKQPLSRFNPKRGVFCTSGGRPIETSVSITAYHVFCQIEEQAANLYRLGSCEQHGSLLNFIGLRIQQELHNFPQHQRQDAARVMFGMSHGLRSRLGDDLSLVSADQYGSYIEMPGGSVRIPLGYVGVLAPLLRQIPENTIRYSTPVDVIKWGKLAQSAGARAQVQCCDGKILNADYVIVTVSLGCLKCHAERLFCPALPSSKIDAIEALGFGLCDRIFFEYCKPFWVPREGHMKMAWAAEEMSGKGDWIRGVSSVEELPDSLHVLSVSISGHEAAQMETLTERDVAEGLTKLLRRFTCNPCLPYPNAILRSRWASDPHFCGTSSYLKCGSGVEQQCQLGAPLPHAGPCEPTPPVLLFAGEATVPGHFATVHGARISGIREAERIIYLTNKFGGPPR